MEKDFHYHIIYSIAKLTGFRDAEIIAYSSQFVDDNNDGLYRLNGERTFFPEKIQVDGGYYYPIMTQALSPKSLNSYVQKYVYVPFHFLPGDNNITINKKRNKLSTTANSKNAQALLASALTSDNPYRIGIALHTFADTWSHQNFTGVQEGWNSIYPWYNVFKSIAPNIGHAEAGHSPDIISATWTDYRLRSGKDEISNKGRALEAIAEIYKTLRNKSGKGPSWDKVKGDYSKIVAISDYDKRICQIAKLLDRKKEGKIPKYSQDTWIGQALDRKKSGIVLKPNFIKTHWYEFHQAAKTHLAFVLDLIKEI